MPDRRRERPMASPFWRGAVRRLPLIAAGLAAFALVLQVSIAGTFRDTRPNLALRFAPIDAGARTKLASAIIASAQTAQARDLARALASDAVLRDPVAPGALRVIALSLDEGPRAQDNVAKLMLQSQRLSRRDRLTQLWLINYYAQRGDVEAIIEHFDIGLQSSISARADLFPLLMAATGDPRVKQALVRKLGEEPGWTKSFVDYAVRNGTDLDFAAGIAPTLLNPDLPDDRVLFRILLERLSSQSEFELAWQVYRELGRSDGMLRNGDFESTEGLAPFDWELSEDPELWAARERRAGDGYQLHIAAYNGRAGEVAKQLLRLAPGRFQLQMQMGDLPLDAYERPELRIRCANSSGAQLLELSPAEGGAKSRIIDGRFTVPSGCAFQWIAITAAGEGSLRDPLPWVDNISIVKER